MLLCQTHGCYPLSLRPAHACLPKRQDVVALDLNACFLMKTWPKSATDRILPVHYKLQRVIIPGTTAFELLCTIDQIYVLQVKDSRD